MGTLSSAPQKLAAFSNDVYPSGLDLNRSDIRVAKGHWRAAAAASFRAGNVVMLTSAGEVDISAGDEILGVAKWQKSTSFVGKFSDVAVVLTGSTAVTLPHADVIGTSFIVASAVNQGGSIYAQGTDYTINTTNGTIVRNGSGITSGSTVYVTFSFNLSTADLAFQGTNFWGSADWVSIQDQRITVIEQGDIYTTEYIGGPTSGGTGVQYALTGAGSNIYVTSGGLFTNATGALDATRGTTLVGYVIQLPQSGDPFLGIHYFGPRVVRS